MALLGYAQTVESLPTRRASEILLWCRIIDERHGVAQAMAIWQTPAGPLCQHHCEMVFPGHFAHREPSSRSVATPERMAIANYKLAAGIRRKAAEEHEMARAAASKARTALEEADEQLAKAAHGLREVLEA